MAVFVFVAAMLILVHRRISMTLLHHQSDTFLLLVVLLNLNFVDNNTFLACKTFCKSNRIITSYSHYDVVTSFATVILIHDSVTLKVISLY